MAPAGRPRAGQLGQQPGKGQELQPPLGRAPPRGLARLLPADKRVKLALQPNAALPLPELRLYDRILSPVAGGSSGQEQNSPQA